MYTQFMYNIGFEIEKQFIPTIVRDVRIKEVKFEIIKEVIKEPSCGEEIITHPMELTSNMNKRKEIFNKFIEAQHLIATPITVKCGTHATLTIEGENDGEKLLEKIKPYASVLYALYKNRLFNNYCCGNFCLLTDKEIEKGIEGLNNKEYKYNTISSYADRLEFRLFPAIKNHKELYYLYSLIYIVVDSAYKQVDQNEYLNKIKNFLEDYYWKPSALENLFFNAKWFNKAILNRETNPIISKYIRNTKWPESYQGKRNI